MSKTDVLILMDTFGVESQEQLWELLNNSAYCGMEDENFIQPTIYRPSNHICG